jgi:hypothetical protein
LAGKDCGAVIDDEALAAAKAMGMPDDELAKVKAEAKEAAERDALQVWPENWRPLMLAVAMQTQARTTMGGVVGFDYTALPVVEARIGLAIPDNLEDQADDFAAFRVIERIYFER